VFSLISLVPVLICAIAFSPLDLSVAAYARVLLALLVGAIPLGLLGIMIGYLLTERGALPVTNLLFLPLPTPGVCSATPWLNCRASRPSSHPGYRPGNGATLIVDFGLDGHFPVHQSVALAAYGIVFGALAILGYRRDETRQYE